MNEDKRQYNDEPQDDDRWNRSPEADASNEEAPEETPSTPKEEMNETPQPAVGGTTPSPEPVSAAAPQLEEEETKGTQSSMMIVIILVVVALAVAAWFLFFSGGGVGQNLLPGGNDATGEDNSAAVTRSYPEVIAVVDGKEVSRAALIEAVASVGRQAQSQGLDMGDRETQQLVEDQALTTLLNTTLLLQAAEDAEIRVGDAEIDAEIAQLKTQLGGEEGFAAQLEAMGLSESEVRQDVAEQLLINGYLATVSGLDQIVITDEEIQAFYDQVSAGGQELPPLGDVSGQIEQQLRSQAEQEVLAELIAELRAEADIEVFIDT